MNRIANPVELASSANDLKHREFKAASFDQIDQEVSMVSRHPGVLNIAEIESAS
jgi:hypothetical protein